MPGNYNMLYQIDSEESNTHGYQTVISGQSSER